jgi:hypothetical protein
MDKELEQGTQGCIVKQSQSQVSAWALSQFKDSGEVVVPVITGVERSGSQAMITAAPGCSLTTGGHCPLLERWSVPQGTAVP